jgi:hypothetical protein
MCLLLPISRATKLWLSELDATVLIYTDYLFNKARCPASFVLWIFFHLLLRSAMEVRGEGGGVCDLGV